MYGLDQEDSAPLARGRPPMRPASMSTVHQSAASRATSRGSLFRFPLGPFHRLRLAGSIRGTFLLILVLVLVPVLVVQALIYYGSFQRELANESRANLELARSVGSAFDSYVDDILRQEMTVGLAFSSPHPPVADAARDLLKTSVAESAAARYYSLTDAQGLIVASSEPTVVGTRIGDRRYFRSIVAGQEKVVSELIVGRASGKPTFSIARAVRNSQGVLQGVIVASVDPDRLNEVLPVQRAGLGTIALLDSSGREVYTYPEVSQSWDDRAVLAPQPAVQRSLAGEELAATLAYPPSGSEAAPRQWVGGLVAIRAYGWVALAARPESEVTGPILEPVLRDFGLLLGVALAASAVALLLARRLTSPLGDLQAHALAIGQGELGRVAPETGTRELRDLANAFNRMGAEVRDREARLVEANGQIREESAMAEAARAEAARQAAQQQALLQNLGEAVTIVRADGRVLLRNEAARQITGITAEALETIVAQRRVYILGLDGKPLPFEDWPISRALRGERLIEVEAIVQRPDGARRRILASSSAVRDPAGQVVLAIIVYRDVTALRELEQAKEGYLHSITHDLRNPLTVVFGYAQLLQQHPENAAIVRQGADHIATSAQRMQAMIQDLLDSARLESGSIQLTLEPVNLGDFLEDLRSRLATAMDVERVRVEVPDLPPVRADPARLERIVVNLVGNALKYFPHDREVTVTASRQDGAVLVSVADSGPGIPPEEIPNLFQRFYRTAQAGSVEGLGLGLYITKGLVEAHGGRIWVESTVGAGSTFRFSLQAVDQ